MRGEKQRKVINSNRQKAASEKEKIQRKYI